MKNLEGKTAIVTGAAGGIGTATARALHSQGAKVMLVDLPDKQEELKRLASELGNGNGSASYCPANVTRSEDVKKYVVDTIEQFGKVDVFFDNAGVEGEVKPTHEYSEEEFDKVWNTNVKGVWLGLKYVMPEMKKNGGGSIIITSSVLGMKAFPNMTAYVTSKHAIVGTMRTAALEGAADNIRVNTVHPGPVDDRMMRSLEEQHAPGDVDKAKKMFTGDVPMGRYVKPDEVARMVTFLASDDSNFITGGMHTVDGGESIN